MSIPTTAEANIYDLPVKIQQTRVVSSIGPRMWTDDMEETFDTPLDPADFWFTQYGGDAPAVDGGALLLRTFGGPPREMVVTRKHWLPVADNLAFEITVNATFPEADPVYPAVITVGGVEQSFGVEHEPMRIIQKGSGHVGGVSVGRIYVDGAGAIVNLDNTGSYANDMAPHDYTVRWNPDAAGGAGAEILTVLRDGTIVWETSEPAQAVQPRYIAFGLIQGSRPDAEPLGTPDEPATILAINTLTVTALGDGHEDEDFPAWTVDNDGGDLNSAEDGERFVMDTVTWAKVPVDAIDSWRIEGGRDTLSDTVTVTLHTPLPENPEDTPNRFAGTNWIGRTLLVDTRVGSEAGLFTPWKRQICALIESADIEGVTLTLTGRDRPMSRLDTFISRSYVDIDDDGNADGSIEGTNIGYSIGEILGDLLDVADTIAGGGLGDTARNIQAPDVLPHALSSGGQSLLPVFAEWCDRLVLECWRRYRTSGDARYGEVNVNLWTFGSGTAGYTFAGHRSTSNFENVISLRLHESSRDGAGGVFYRQDNPAFGPLLQSLEFLPLVGTFPTAPYPVTGRVVNDSIAYVETTTLSVLLGWPKADSTLETGGVARHRYRRENTSRRRVTAVVEGHDWVEPVDEVAFDDPGHTGLAATETWVVSNRSVRYEESKITTTFECVTADWLGAVMRAL